jgi:hypothetical protein
VTLCRRFAVLLLTLMAASNLFAQTNEPQLLAALVLSETPALDTAPDLARWRTLHPDERLRPAAYDNEYESQGLWCAASIAEVALPGGIHATRQAFFYLPSAKTGDALPARQDAGLVQHCRLLALWYEVGNPAGPSSLAKSVSTELAASLGPGEEPSRFKRPIGDWGSGNWDPYFIWERPNRRVILAFDPGRQPVPEPNARTRLLVIARAPQAPTGLSFDWMGEFPKGQPSFKEAATRVAAQGSPAERNAATVVLADFTRKRLVEPGQGPTAYRSRAEQMDPTGAGGEIARVAHAESPCAFDDGRNNWQGGLIQFGEKLLRDFPASPWKPYIHLTIARAYAAKLILTYPDIELNGENRPTDPDALRRNAIVHFRAFLAEAPNSPESAVARREAWRLLAGLPPTQNHFACTD